MIPLQLQRATLAFPAPVFDLNRLGAHLQSQLGGLRPLPPGTEVAVAVGSRGIANLARIVRATIDELQARGLRPFIFPAMGSHGGATAEGQTELLASYGVTAAAMGCEVRATMEVVSLDATGLEHALYLDAHAARAPAILLINRIKPHTDFHGRYESGLIKMSVIGLGKERQALEIHRFGVRGLRDLLPLAAARVLATGRIWGGVGVVENAYDQTAEIAVLAADQLLAREPELLARAAANMPKLPVDELDVLLVDRLGKNISGTGLDTNIIGRIRIAGQPEPPAPRIGAIAVGDLTEESHGNAVGLGLADVITERLLAKMNPEITRINVVTSGFLERGKIPVTAPTDAAAFALAARSCFASDLTNLRVIRIRDTLHLGDIAVSPAVARALAGRRDVTLHGQPADAFNAAGSLVPWAK